MTTTIPTNLIPDLYAALDVVSRELVGRIPAVTMDASVDRAAVNQNVRVAIAPANTAGADITPAMAIPAEADQTIDNVSIAITKARAFLFSWNGEEQRGVNSGPGYLSIRANQIAQAMRAAVNEVEADLTALRTKPSRAAGTAGTTPFATNTAGLTAARKILVDNLVRPCLTPPWCWTPPPVLRCAPAKREQRSRRVEAARSPPRAITRINDLNVRESGQIDQHGGHRRPSRPTPPVMPSARRPSPSSPPAAPGLWWLARITLPVTPTSTWSPPVIPTSATAAPSSLRPACARPSPRRKPAVITIVAAAARNMAFSRRPSCWRPGLPERPGRRRQRAGRDDLSPTTAPACRSKWRSTAAIARSATRSRWRGA